MAASKQMKKQMMEKLYKFQWTLNHNYTFLDRRIDVGEIIHRQQRVTCFLMLTPQSGVMRNYRIDYTKNGPIRNYDMLHFDITNLLQKPLNEGDWKLYNDLLKGIDKYCDEHVPGVEDIHGIKIIDTHAIEVYHDDNDNFTVNIKDLKI